MKRWLIVLGTVALFLVVAAGVFLATFDADRYRPLLANQLTAAVGAPVELGHLSLAWRGGLAVQVDGLQIAGAAGAEPVLTVQSASAIVRLWPLLQRNVQVVSVAVTAPRVRLSRAADRTVGLAGVTPPGTAAAPNTAATPGAAATALGGSGPPPALALFIRRIDITDGAVAFHDAARQPPLDVAIDQLHATLRNVSFTGPVDAATAVEMRVTDGRVTLASLRQPLEHITLEARLGKDRLELRQAGAQLGEGRLTATGTVTDLSHHPQSQLELSVTRLPLEAVMPPAVDGQSQLSGRLSLTLHGTGRGMAWADLAPTLSGQGSLQLDDGTITNLNILRDVFAQLSILPGLVQALEERLPPSYRERLEARDTILRPLHLTVTAQDGQFAFTNLQVETDSFALAGSSTLGWNGALTGKGILRLDPQLSAAVIRSVKELQALANKDGQLELPLKLGGTWPSVAVAPDLKYVTRRLAAGTVNQLLERAFRRPAESAPTENAPSPGEAPAPKRKRTGAAILNELLRAATSETPAQSPPSSNAPPAAAQPSNN